MNFYYPFGLLGLIGVPILIIIYIIKSKYTEQTVASTYLWELSERFLKKRKPVSKITGIITLILQILAVVTVSLLIAHPVFTIPASANDYFFILDGSASMNMTQNGETRFEKAQKQINSVIDKSKGGSSYTLALAGDSVNVMFEGITDKEQAKIFINGLKAGWNSADCSSAVNFAQDYFDSNRSALVYLVTDKQYETENIELIDVSGGEVNYAFADYGYELVANGITASGTVVSYSSDATLTVELLLTVDGKETSCAQTKVSAAKGVSAEFTLNYKPGEMPSFTALKLRIAEADALAEDNVIILYDKAKSADRTVLLVNGTEDGVYLKQSLEYAGNATVTAMSSIDYAETYVNGNVPEGYGMYVYNGYAPEKLPTNAAIWLLNAVTGTDSGSGITYRDTLTPRDKTGPESYYTAKYSKNTSSQAKELMLGLVKRDVAVRTYAKYGVPRNYTNILEYNGDALITAGLNGNNDRQVVFAFELGNSSLAMLDDFLILVRNLMNYSFPQVIDETVYDCGENLVVNVVPGCRNIAVTSPSGNTVTLDTVDNDVCELALTETGTYTINVTVAGKQEDSVLYAYARVPEVESRNPAGEAIYLAGDREFNYSDGFYDKLLAFFILITVLLLADWGVYCYEQYQLR